MNKLAKVTNELVVITDEYVKMVTELVEKLPEIMVKLHVKQLMGMDLETLTAKIFSIREQLVRDSEAMKIMVALQSSSGMSKSSIQLVIKQARKLMAHIKEGREMLSHILDMGGVINEGFVIDQGDMQ